MIEETELAELRNQYPRDKRKRIEQRWAFNEITNILTKDNIGLKNFDALRYLLSYTYGMGSHLAHQDGTGLRLIHNRVEKTFEDARSDELAHASRQINDLLMMAFFHSAITYHLHHADIKPVMDLFESHQQFISKMAKVREDWWKNYIEHL